MSLPSIQRVFLESVASSDPEGRFVEVDNILTYYKVAIPQHQYHNSQNYYPSINEQNKPVILCLHQFMGNLYTWRFQMQSLADATGCHVVAYDRPAYGFTERPTQWEENKNPYTSEFLVEFTVQFMRAIGYGEKKIIFIGCSIGPAISCAVALKYPHLVHSIIMLGPSLKDDDQGPPPAARFIVGSLPGRLYLKAALYRNFPLTILYHDVNTVPEWESVVKPCYRVPLTLPNFYEGVSWAMKYFVPLEVMNYKSFLQQYPICFVCGDADKYTHVDRHKKVYSELSSGAPPNALIEFHVLESCGHIPQDEKPEEVLNLCINFIKRTGV
ncbi:hypothetical protein Glove_712g32 [Diversispora epigaea]|uniref:AB hydrolase-1 domain-containing protein n=1 Tax=Diversispora epigaea TaxID=1348612 RepID=A0A397G557_9GLOM|nr:hypothetical protein Glove_712g32 [Diversispora epigaea]